MIRFWNPGASRIFGFARAEAIDRSLDLVIPERLCAAPVVDANGRVAGMAAILRDVAALFEEMKALRRRLAASEPKPNGA